MSKEYEAYTYSLAAVNFWEWPDSEKEEYLKHCVGIGSFMDERLLGHLGLANLYYVKMVPDKFLFNLDQAKNLALFRNVQIKEMVFLCSARQSLGFAKKTLDNSERRELINYSINTLDELAEMEKNNFPFSLLIINSRAACYRENENFDQAINEWRKIITGLEDKSENDLAKDEKYVNNGNVYENIATCYIGLGRCRKALEYLSKARNEYFVRKQGVSTQFKIWEVICYFKTGNFKKSETLANEIKQTTFRGEYDYAIIGLALHGEKRLIYFGKALGGESLNRIEINYDTCQQLAKICNQKFGPVNFRPEEFREKH
jgi:tetratricopeptide (TPR) repeat protein